MFSKPFLTVLIATLATVHADPNPSAPGPGDVFKEGGDCTFSWDVDATGTWKVMNVELMSGSNLQMNHITTVATVDATDPSKNSFTYPCPDVVPNSAIYFYQFSSPAAPKTYWTTRFTITDRDGKSDPPANPTQSSGDAIPWGIGALEDPSKAIPPPPPPGSAAGGNGTTSNSPSGGTGSSGSNTSTGSTPSATPTPQPQQQNSGLVKTPSSTPTSTPTPTNQGASVNKDNSAAVALHMPIAVSGALALLGFALML